MRRLLLLLLLLLSTGARVNANPNWHDWCWNGGQKVITSGLGSTTLIQGSSPQCIVSVFVHGGGVATIYSDNSNTPLANPFVAQTNGQILWYAANGRYDQTITVTINGLTQTVTMSDIVLGVAGGTGCALPGIDTGVLSEHPAGTCYDSLNWTWDDGVSKQNMQIGGTNLVGTQQTYMVGSGNTLTGVNFSSVVGYSNLLEYSPSSPAQPSLYVLGDNNNLFSYNGSAASGIVGEGNALGDPAHATSGGFNTWVLGDVNALYLTRNVVVLNYSNSLGEPAGSGVLLYGVVSGYTNTVNCCLGHNNSVQDFGIYGDSNDIAVQAGGVSSAFIGGFTNHCEGDDGQNAGCYIWGLDNADHGGQTSDVVIVGSSNTTHTRLNAATFGASDNFIAGALNTVANSGNFFVYGANNNVTGCTAYMLVGFSMTSCANNTLSLGVSATPEVTITDKYFALRAIAFASLGTPANGNFVYCNDCTVANPCNSGGTGALAKRLNGVWVCN
jgi:hypothetical protein